MSALKKRYYQKIDEEIYSASLDNGLSLSIIKKKGFLEKAAFLSINFAIILMESYKPILLVLHIFLNINYLRMSKEKM